MRSSRTTTALFVLVLVMDMLAAVVAAGAVNVDPSAAFATGRHHVKVAIIVGPVGRLTNYYRELADEAAAAARAMTDDVVTVYSPDATWPAARAALLEASIVLYLGHGNGWPSPYREKLYRRTQNGLGLNPVAGVDDNAHQYFGEQYIAGVQLAHGAVVILSHLCYASGNPEPGGPEPSVEVAGQRVDNFAAGWMAAGATAVLAEGHGRPAYYLQQLLRGRGTIEGMWRAAPSFNDHVIKLPSSRTAEAQLMLDPDRPSRGFFRSLAVKPGARVAQTLRSARSASPPARGPGEPSSEASPAPSPTPDPRDLAALEARFGTPAFVGSPIAGTEARLTLPLDAATLKLLPDAMMVGTRWDPLTPGSPTAGEEHAAGMTDSAAASLAPVEAQPGTPSSEASPTNVTAGAATPAPAGTARPEASDGQAMTMAPAQVPAAGTPAASLAPAAPATSDPPTIDLIGPEMPGETVTTHPSVRGEDGLTVLVSVPTEPGPYRLVTTIHDSEGVAFDAATQDLIGALLVEVTGQTWASYGMPAELVVQPDEAFTIRVRVANTGTLPWAHRTWGVHQTTTSKQAPLLVARWLNLDNIETYTSAAGSTVLTPAPVRPGSELVLDIPIVAPKQPGRYLLMYDVQDDQGVSLASVGVPVGLTRVFVHIAPDPPTMTHARRQ